MNVERLFTTRPAIATVFARLDGTPALVGLEVEPVGIAQYVKLRDGVPHVYRSTGRSQRVDGVGGRRAISAHRATTAHEVLNSRPAHIVTRRTDAAMHKRHGVERLGNLLARRNLRHGLAKEEIDLVYRGDFSGKLGNTRGRHATDRLGPLRRLFDHVVAGTHDIVSPRRILGSALRHMVAVKADAVLVQIVLVIRAVGNPLMADGDHEGAVRTRQNRHPLIGNNLSSLVEPGINDDDFCAAFTALLHVPSVVARLVCRPVATKEHVQVAAQGLQVMRRVCDSQPTKHVRVHNGQCTEGNRTRFHVDRTAQGIKEHDVLVVVTVTNVGGSAAQDTLGAVGIQRLLDTSRHQVEGLIPVKAFPLVATAQLAVRIVKREMLALHGILDACGRQNLAHLCAAAQARTTLRNSIGILFRLIRTGLEWHAVLNVYTVEASRRTAAAVVVARCVQPNTFFRCSRLLRMGNNRAFHQTRHRSRPSKRGSPLDKTPSRQ